MSSERLCPFCGNVMIPAETKGTYKCPADSFRIDLNARSGMFGAGAPNYLLESARFLNLFRVLKPMYVFSPEKLYSQFFKLSDCVFVEPKEKSDDVVCVRGYRLNYKNHVKGKHLIAANKFIADGLFSYVYNSIRLGCFENPLLINEIPTAFDQLHLKYVLANNDDKYADREAFAAAKAYFQPTLEAMSSSIWPLILNTNYNDTVTDEMALYSYLMCEPQINIKWGVGAAELMSNIKSFVRACLKDINTIKVTDNCDEMLMADSKYHIDDKLIKELFILYLSSMPSTAVNCVSDVNSTFCVLNHEFKNNPFEGVAIDKLDNNVVVALSQIYSTHEYMFMTYCYDNVVRFSTQQKIEWLINNCGYTVKSSDTPSKAVVAFWQKFAEKLDGVR